jgi:glycosyltransferase involved in cell wall biosynthesis
MGRGGIETWLMHLLRKLDRTELVFDFLVDATEPAAYDAEILSLGSRIIRCPRERNLFAYRSRLFRALKDAAPIDVLHAHADLFNGFVLAVAKSCGVKTRIAHSHIDMRLVGRKSDPLRRVYYSGLRTMLLRSMTHGIGVSEGAALDMFGPTFASKPGIQVLPCGIDYGPFEKLPNAADVRQALSIPLDAKVVGHVGRFDPQKNHRFLVEAFAAAARRDAKLHLLLVGGGALQEVTRAQVAHEGLSDRVTFAGIQSDIPRILTAMDAFVFPSTYEGLGLVIIEAEAAGLPVVVSDCIPTDALLPSHWIRRLPLGPPESWTESILEAVSLGPKDRRKTTAIQFNVDWNLQTILATYRAAVAGHNVTSNKTDLYGR